MGHFLNVVPGPFSSVSYNKAHYPHIGQIQRGGLQPRNDSRPRFPYRIVRGGESPQGIIREDYTRAKRENDGIRVGCFGRQAQQPLESMMIYQHINIPTYQHANVPAYQHANMQTYHYGDIYCRFNSSFQGKAEQSFPFTKAK